MRDLVAAAIQILSSQGSCTANLGGQRLSQSTGGAGTITGIFVTRTNNTTGAVAIDPTQPLLTVGKPFRPLSPRGIIVGSMTMVDKTTIGPVKTPLPSPVAPDGYVAPAGAAPIIHIAQFVITATRPSFAGIVNTGAQTLTDSFPVKVLIDPATQTITSCGAAVVGTGQNWAGQEICEAESQGGTYYSPLQGGSCVPKVYDQGSTTSATCPQGKVVQSCSFQGGSAGSSPTRTLTNPAGQTVVSQAFIPAGIAVLDTANNGCKCTLAVLPGGGTGSGICQAQCTDNQPLSPGS